MQTTARRDRAVTAYVDRRTEAALRALAATADRTVSTTVALILRDATSPRDPRAGELAERQLAA